jgi:hypothetical protein
LKAEALVRKLALAFAVLLAPVLAADEIHLVGGGTIVGEIVERSADRVVVETGPGRVTLPMTRVTAIKEGRSALAGYKDRLRAIDAKDAAGFIELARWAAAQGLETQAREAFERALQADPGSAEANAALGRLQMDGRWMSRDDAYRAQGLVPYEGRWVTPAERDSAERARAESVLADHAEREAESRAREAEARARVAEAEARQAEAAAEATDTYTDGIPFWPYLYGGGGVILDDGRPDRPHRPRRRPPARPGPQPTPPPGGTLTPTTPANPPPPAPAKPAPARRTAPSESR